MRLFLILSFSLFFLSCDKIKSFLKEPPVSIETEEDKTSYALGYLMSNQVKEVTAINNSKAFCQGAMDSAENKPPVLSKVDLDRIDDDISKKIRLKKQAEQNERNKMTGQEFLEGNKQKETVKVTETGLQYEVLNEGKGKAPLLSDTVEVHYKGTLIDGTEFDSSYKREQTAVFPLSNVIKGWQEGLQLMKGRRSI